VRQAVVDLTELKVESDQVNVYCLMTAGTAPRKIGINVVLSTSSDCDRAVKDRLCQRVGEVVDDYLTLHQADAGTIEGIIVTTKTIDPSREGSAQLERAFL
jgi:azurin